jgi:hypothetical protein
MSASACRTSARDDVARTSVVDGLFAVRAANLWSHHGAAWFVQERERRLAAVEQPTVAPGEEGEDHGIEVPAFARQQVLGSRWTVLIRLPVENAVLDEMLKPLGNDVTGGPRVVMELGEPRRAEECLTEDQQCPSVTDDRQRSRDRATART